MNNTFAGLEEERKAISLAKRAIEERERRELEEARAAWEAERAKRAAAVEDVVRREADDKRAERMRRAEAAEADERRALAELQLERHNLALAECRSDALLEVVAAKHALDAQLAELLEAHAARVEVVRAATQQTWEATAAEIKRQQPQIDRHNALWFEACRRAQAWRVETRTRLDRWYSESCAAVEAATADIVQARLEETLTDVDIALARGADRRRRDCLRDALLDALPPAGDPNREREVLTAIHAICEGHDTKTRARAARRLHELRAGHRVPRTPVSLSSSSKRTTTSRAWR